MDESDKIITAERYNAVPSDLYRATHRKICKHIIQFLVEHMARRFGHLVRYDPQFLLPLRIAPSQRHHSVLRRLTRANPGRIIPGRPGEEEPGTAIFNGLLSCVRLIGGRTNEKAGPLIS